MFIMLVNSIAIAVGVARTLYSPFPQWSRLVGGVFFSFWVLCHLYPFAKGLMGRRGKVPTIIYVWSGLLSIIISFYSIFSFCSNLSIILLLLLFIYFFLSSFSDFFFYVFIFFLSFSFSFLFTLFFSCFSLLLFYFLFSFYIFLFIFYFIF